MRLCEAAHDGWRLRPARKTQFPGNAPTRVHPAARMPGNRAPAEPGSPPPRHRHTVPKDNSPSRPICRKVPLHSPLKEDLPMIIRLLALAGLGVALSVTALT